MKSRVPGRKSSSVRRRRAAAVLATGAAIAAAPQVEAATFNVLNADDAGAGSLRQAILDANALAGADTVTFDGAVTGPIVLTSGELWINDSLTITGPGAANLTISGNDASRIFYTYRAGGLIDVTITGLTLTNGTTGEAASGGAIFNYGENLTLEGVTVANSLAACCGGGIASFDVAGEPNAFVIRDSTVTANTAEGSGGGIGLAVYELGSTALIENVTITGNTAGVPGDPMSFATGGGIDVANYGNVTIRDSRITGNEATGDGGGISASITLDLDIENSTISDNVALSGGGIGVFQGYDITITDTTISGNTAGIPDGASAYVGGGLYAVVVNDLTIAGSTISGNTVAGGGGGIGIYAVVGEFLLTNSTISGNQAAHPSFAYGGGVLVAMVYDDTEAPEDDGSFRAEFSTITGNVADVAGGVFSYETPAPIPLVSTVIAGNTAASAPDVVGSFDVTASFIGDPDGGTITGAPLTGAPMLGPLADNGGPTLTHMPLAGSPLLNSGANPSALTTDQRGTPRVREFPAGDPDIGSVEVQTGDGPTEFNFNPVAIGVAEGAGTTNLVVERTNSSGAASIDVAVTGGTATGSGTDFTFTTVTLEFADLETAPRNVPVGITQDALDEANETIDFALQNPVSATVGANGAAVVTILDDEAGVIQFDPTVYLAGEGDGTVSITATRTGPADVAVSADIVVTGGTATGGGTDFTYATGTVSWAAGELGARSVSVAITPDTIDEPDETVIFELQNITGGASAGVATAQLTIEDENSPGILQFEQSGYSVSEDGTSVDVTMTRTGGVAGEVSVQVVVTGGTATNGGVDYTLGSPVVTWADGDAAPKTVSIPIVDDSLLESDETIDLQLQNATGSAVIGTPAATVVTIMDEDSAGGLGFASATWTVNESDGTVTITVNRLGGSDGEVSVQVVVTGGTAENGTDYTFGATTLVWPEGDDTPKTFTISITNDGLPEGPETITLALQNATGGAVITEGATTVTIISAAAAAAAIPTLDGWMRILMAGMLALLAVGLIRRGRFLASILLAAFLLSSSPALAADETRPRRGTSADREAPAARRARGSVDLVSMASDGDKVVLTLDGGEVLRLDASKVRVAGQRRGRCRQDARGAAVIEAADGARVRLLRGRNGEVLFARVIVAEPAAAGQER